MKGKVVKKKKTVTQPEEPHPTGIFVSSTAEEKSYFAELGEEVVSTDTRRCQSLLSDFKLGEGQILRNIEQLVQYTADEETVFDSGLNFYSCKNLLFNEYLICLKFYELFKLKGISLAEGEGLNLYKKLVYLKTLILKLAPVEKKLEYQKNKLLKKGEKAKIESFQKPKLNIEADEDEDDVADIGVEREDEDEEDAFDEGDEEQAEEEDQDEEDNLIYRPQIGNLISAEKKKNKEDLSTKKYVPVKQSQVLPADEKEKRRFQRQKERRNAFLLKKFRGDIDSGDEAEEKGILNEMDEKFKRKYDQKTRLEEENFTRLAETKKEKYWRKQMMKNQFRGNQLNDEIKEVEMIRNLVDKEAGQTQRTPAHPKPPNPKKKRKPN